MNRLYIIAVVFLLIVAAILGNYFFPVTTLFSGLELPSFPGWSVAIILMLLLVNALQFIGLKAIFRWRRTLKGGMEAVVPTELMDSFKGWQTFLSKRDSAYTGIIKDIHTNLRELPKSLEIFKSELEVKESELRRLRGVSETIEKEKTLKKLTGLHLKFSKMETQIKNGGISSEIALEFLKDDISEVFEELGVELILPIVGSPVKAIFSDGYSVNGEIQVSDQSLDLTVAEVLSPGYLYRSLGGEVRVLKSAVIILNRFGV